MTWDDVLADPSLNSVPYKVESNSWGQLVLTPRTNLRAVRLGHVATRVLHALHPHMMISVPIQTRDGVRVADAAWASLAFVHHPDNEVVFATAPPLCVIVCDGTTPIAETEYRLALYLDAGAREVWVSEEDGTMRFYTPEGEQEMSLIVPDAPERL